MKGSGEFDFERVYKIKSLGDGIEELACGKSRKPVRKRIISVKVSISVIAKVLMDLNCISVSLFQIR